jgi:hypothetical protein
MVSDPRLRKRVLPIEVIFLSAYIQPSVKANWAPNHFVKVAVDKGINIKISGTFGAVF